MWFRQKLPILLHFHRLHTTVQPLVSVLFPVKHSGFVTPTLSPSVTPPHSTFKSLRRTYFVAQACTSSTNLPSQFSPFPPFKCFTLCPKVTPGGEQLGIVHLRFSLSLSMFKQCRSWSRYGNLGGKDMVQTAPPKTKTWLKQDSIETGTRLRFV